MIIEAGDVFVVAESTVHILSLLSIRTLYR
jgi:hypothetical protein